MFVLLSSSQQLLDILGDLLGFADDVFCAGKCGVWLHLQIIQLRDRAALPQPATAPQPHSPAQTVGEIQMKLCLLPKSLLIVFILLKNRTLYHVKTPLNCTQV